MPRVLAIIPARGGSKGIPHKNIAPCAGKPLIAWTYEAVRDSKLITEAVVSSDDPKILASVGLGLRAMRRPDELATDEATTESVIEHVLTQYQGDIIVLLQPTSPIRTGQQIDHAVRILQHNGYDSVLSVSSAHVLIWQEDRHGLPMKPNYDYRHRPRRQDKELFQWQENGSIYVFSHSLWERNHNRLGGKIGLYKMGVEEGYQVDTPLDLFIVEQILLRRQGVK